MQDSSGIDWDDAFDNSGYVPESGALADRWAGQAGVFRAQADCDLDVAYGPGARNRLDLFRPEGTAKGLVVFVHGGYWHKFDKSYWSHLAAGPQAAGWAVAVPSYTLAPEARIAQIVTEVAMAITHAAGAIDGPIRLIGHSAGGHLVSRMICADGPLPDHIAGRLAQVVSVSGVHDLRPLLATRMNDTLRLDPAEAEAQSPALLPPLQVPVCFWTGASERPEFLRQGRLITEAWQRSGAPARDVYQPGMNHFTVIEPLGVPGSPLVAALLGGAT